MIPAIAITFSEGKELSALPAHPFPHSSKYHRVNCGGGITLPGGVQKTCGYST